MSETLESAKSFAQDVVDGHGIHTKRESRWGVFWIDLGGLVFDGIGRDPDSGERNYRAIGNRTIPSSHLRYVGSFVLERE